MTNLVWMFFCRKLPHLHNIPPQWKMIGRNALVWSSKTHAKNVWIERKLYLAKFDATTLTFHRESAIIITTTEKYHVINATRFKNRYGNYVLSSSHLIYSATIFLATTVTNRNRLDLTNLSHSLLGLRFVYKILPNYHQGTCMVHTCTVSSLLSSNFIWCLSRTWH